MKQIRFNLAIIRALRGKLTQREVALATGLSQKTISALETGASKGVDFLTLAKLCDYLQCKIDDLLLLEDEIEDIAPSNQSLEQAKKIIDKGLKRAMDRPPLQEREIWAEFDSLRAKINSANK